MTNSKNVNICVVGGAGRMGRRVIDVCNGLESVNVVSVLVRPDDQGRGHWHGPGRNRPERLAEGTDVIIDFSRLPSTDTTLKAAVDLGVAYVLASTGLSDKDEEDALRGLKKYSLNCRFQLQFRRQRSDRSR